MLPPSTPPPQELKGNIRVFCRVRPALQSELEAAGSGTEPVATSFPTAGGRPASHCGGSATDPLALSTVCKGASEKD